MQQNKDGQLQLFKPYGLFSLVLLFSTAYLYAGTFDEFKRTQSQSFTKYKDERDNEFNKYLKSQWQAYKVTKGKVIYEDPKPAKLPNAAPIVINKVGPKVNIKVIKKNPIKKPKLIVEKPIILIVKDKIEQPKDSKKKLEIEFFGSKHGFSIPDGLKKANFYPRNKVGVTSFFDIAAGSEYEQLILEIKKLKKDLSLNDWAIYLLINKVSSKIYTNADNA